MAVAAALAACSGDENQAPATSDPTPSDATETDNGAGTASVNLDRVRVVDTGSEPRTLLRIDRDTPITVNVSASHTNQGKAGDQPFGDKRELRYQLRVRLSNSGASGDIQARIQASLDGAAKGSRMDSLDFPQWQVGPNGVLTAAEPPSIAGDRRLVGLLASPSLFLMVPDQPVGPGASWIYPDAAAQFPVEIHLDAIDEEGITARISLQRELPDASVSVTATGIWDRQSLVARRVTHRVELSYSAKTTRNGKPVELKGSKIIAHEYVQ